MSTLDEWTQRVCAELGLEPGTVDSQAVLGLARDVAHGVARPAAPLTAYLLGVAVGRGTAAGPAVQRITELAAAWDPHEDHEDHEDHADKGGQPDLRAD